MAFTEFTYCAANHEAATKVIHALASSFCPTITGSILGSDPESYPIMNPIIQKNLNSIKMQAVNKKMKTNRKN